MSKLISEARTLIVIKEEGNNLILEWSKIKKTAKDLSILEYFFCKSEEDYHTNKDNYILGCHGEYYNEWLGMYGIK